MPFIRYYQDKNSDIKITLNSICFAAEVRTFEAHIWKNDGYNENYHIRVPVRVQIFFLEM